MESSLQVMKQLEAPAAAKMDAKASKLPLLSLLTFSPMGNPLSELSPGQCNLFFDYLMLSLHNQKKEQLERTAALNKKIVLPASLSAAALSMSRLTSEQKMRQAQFGEEMKKTEETKTQREKVAVEEGKRKNDEDAATGSGGGAAGAEGAAGSAGVAGWKFSSLFKKQNEDKKGGEDGGPNFSSPSAMGQKNSPAVPQLPEFSSAYGQKAGVVSGAIGQLAPVIDDYARGNAEKERKVVGNFHESMRASNYVTDDLMASLLMVIEDDAWSGEEGGLGSAKPHGGATRLVAMVPQKLRSSAQDSAVVRLASVREMLRYYFRMHPNDYHGALASALGITADQEEDSTFLQERLAFELASIGSFALAQKLLAQIKLKKKLDTKECLMKLGYRYDVKKKRLILGKRTCGKPAEARGIVSLLLSSVKK